MALLRSGRASRPANCPACASTLDRNHHELLPERRIGFDFLIIAIGSVANDFGIPGVKEHCVFLDNAEQALALRSPLRNRFLGYASHHQPDHPIRIVVVGAGATGTELAAEMHHAVDQLRGFGFRITPALFDVTLIEAADLILPRLGRPGRNTSTATWARWSTCRASTPLATCSRLSAADSRSRAGSRGWPTSHCIAAT